MDLDNTISYRKLLEYNRYKVEDSTIDYAVKCFLASIRNKNRYTLRDDICLEDHYESLLLVDFSKYEEDDYGVKFDKTKLNDKDYYIVFESKEYSSPYNLKIHYKEHMLDIINKEIREMIRQGLFGARYSISIYIEDKEFHFLDVHEDIKEEVFNKHFGNVKDFNNYKIEICNIFQY